MRGDLKEKLSHTKRNFLYNDCSNCILVISGAGSKVIISNPTFPFFWYFWMPPVFAMQASQTHPGSRLILLYFAVG